MQGEVEIDQDNPVVETLPRAFDDDDDDFGDSMINLFDEKSESNAQDESVTVNPELGDDVGSQEAQAKDTQESTSIVAAACSAINEANENTDPSSSSGNRGEEIPGSDQTMNRGMQQQPDSNQIANAVPVSSGQMVVTFPGGLVTQAPMQRPPPPYQQHPMFINPGPAQFGTNPNALMYYGPCRIPTIPLAPAPAQMSVIINEVPYHNPYQHPTANQQPHYNIMNQGYALHDVLRFMEALQQSMHLPPDTQTRWFNTLLHNLQLRYQLPTQSTRFISGPSSHQGQNQQQQPVVPYVVQGQAPVGPMMHNQQQGNMVPYVVRGQAPVGPRMNNQQQGNMVPNVVRGHAPVGPRMHNQQQGNMVPNVVRGQAPVGPRMHNQQQGNMVPNVVHGAAPVRPRMPNQQQHNMVPNVVRGQAPVRPRMHNQQK